MSNHNGRIDWEKLTKKEIEEHLEAKCHMPYSATLTRVKLNLCIRPSDLEPLQNWMGSSLSHATSFHQVTRKWQRLCERNREMERERKGGELRMAVFTQLLKDQTQDSLFTFTSSSWFWPSSSRPPPFLCAAQTDPTRPLRLPHHPTSTPVSTQPPGLRTRGALSL